MENLIRGNSVKSAIAIDTANVNSGGVNFKLEQVDLKIKFKKIYQ